MTTIKEWYVRVNETWPAAVPLPTDEQALRGARRLYRYMFGKTIPAELTSGNRRTWTHQGVLRVNPGNMRQPAGYRGWQGICHDLSHCWHQRINPTLRPHCGAQARLEIRLIKEVIRRGWLEPEKATSTQSEHEVSTRPPIAPKPDPRAARRARVLAGIERWKSKLQRAQRALAKLNRRARYYARQMG